MSKKHLLSLAIRVTQIKTTFSFHLTLVRMASTWQTNVGEDVVKEASLLAVGGSLSWYNHYGNQCGD